MKLVLRAVRQTELRVAEVLMLLQEPPTPRMMMYCILSGIFGLFELYLSLSLSPAISKLLGASEAFQMVAYNVLCPEVVVCRPTDLSGRFRLQEIQFCSRSFLWSGVHHMTWYVWNFSRVASSYTCGVRHLLSASVSHYPNKSQAK